MRGKSGDDTGPPKGEVEDSGEESEVSLFRTFGVAWLSMPSLIFVDGHEVEGDS